MITKEEILLSEVKALSFKDPYASAIVYEGKQETRTRQTHYRGLLLICTSLKAFTTTELKEFSSDKQIEHMQEMYKANGLFLGRSNDWDTKTMGYAIGIAHLSGCKLMGDHETDRELMENKTIIRYDPDRWIWELSDVTRIRPFPFKGAQGWQTLSDHQKQFIEPCQ